MHESPNKIVLHNYIAGLSLATAFLVSIIGDWFFENQWTNPNWYLFEFIVWLVGFGLFFFLFKLDHEASGESEGPIQRRRPLRRYIFAVVVVLSFYVGSYSCLSISGQFVVSQSGRIRYGFGLSVSDISIWQPRFLYWQRFINVSGEKTTRGNFLGYVYCPLIMLDRWSVHPTVKIFGSEK